MPSSLLKDYKSKKACSHCGEHQLTTNDYEKASETMAIHYHCLSCNSQFFEYPGQGKIKEGREKTGSSSANNPSFGSAVTIVLMILATILTVNLVRSNDEPGESQGDVFWPTGRSEMSN